MTSIAGTSGTYRLSVISFLALVLSACAPHWVAEYDSVMDQSVASLQTSTNKFFNEQRSARGTAAGYAANAEFYHSSRAVVKTQAVRAAVLERDLGNAYLSELFTKLEAQYDDLELLHKSYNGRGLTTADIDNASRSFDQAFRSIQAYIHALKSNSEATSE